MRKKLILSEESSLDLTSFLDVIFILLIFAMLAMSFQKNIQIPIEVNLPKTDQKPALGSDSKFITIVLKNNTEIIIDTKPNSFSSVKSQILQGNFNKKEIHLFVDKNVNYESFIHLMDLLKLANKSKVFLGLNKE